MGLGLAIGVLCVRTWGLGFEVWFFLFLDLGFELWGLGIGVWGLGLVVGALGFGLRSPITSPLKTSRGPLIEPSSGCVQTLSEDLAAFPGSNPGNVTSSCTNLALERKTNVGKGIFPPRSGGGPVCGGGQIQDLGDTTCTSRRSDFTAAFLRLLIQITCKSGHHNGSKKSPGV